jgi:hypothetical protein
MHKNNVVSFMSCFSCFKIVIIFSSLSESLCVRSIGVLNKINRITEGFVMKKRILSGLITSLFAVSSHATLVNLNGQGYVTYGDFNSYSLPIAGLNVQSAPGQIQDLIVVATGTNNNPVNTNFAGMDNAYSTPNGGGGNFFSTGTVADADEISGFTGDQDNTWDTSLSALQSFLSGEDMTFFFNNNNLNKENEQSLAAWAQIEIRDDNGLRLGIFDFTNDRGVYGLVSEGGGGTFLGDPTTYNSDGSGPTIGTNADTDYVLSGGAICIDTDTSPPTPVSCSNPAADTTAINHNLGADNVAYAIIAPELNMLLEGLFLSGNNLDNYTMSIDLRLGCDPGFGLADSENCTGASSGFGKNINNGYEQLFIGTAIFDKPDIEVPEPSMLWLMSFALIFMGYRKFS